jgi:uncharacterized protein YdeI (BOF family)
MTKNPKMFLSIAVTAFALTTLTTAPALADNLKKSKKTASHTSAMSAEEAAGGVPESVSTSNRDHKSGPAWRTIGGTVKQIKGDTYTVEDYEGNQVQLFVGQDTKHLRQKKVGDTVRAEVTRGGFANSIQ